MKRKEITLAKTQIELRVPENVYYYDDGIVQNLDAHTEKLNQRYGNPPLSGITLPTGTKQIVGRFYFSIWGGKNLSIYDAAQRGLDVVIHSFVCTNPDETITTFARGHEEAHFLDYFRQRRLLHQAYRAMGYLPRVLDNLPTETFCNVGGFYALLKNIPSGSGYKLPLPEDPHFGPWLCENLKAQVKISNL